MKLWQGALAFPLGAVAAGLGYDLYRRLVESYGWTGGPSSAVGAATAPVAAPAKRVVLPIQPRIAVVELFGPIMGGARITDHVNLMEALRGDRRVRSVVLEIDSPGGSAPASDYLYRAVSRLAAQKPVIAFIRGVGASGAYMVSCAATKIVVLPSAIVGSIGVIHINPVLKDLLKRLGIDVAVTKSGPFKDMGAFYRDATEEEQKKNQELISHFYDDFVELVARSRKMPVETVRKYATGEVYTARQAKEHGLIDELGDMETALDLASQLGEVPRRVVYARPRRPLLQRLISRFSTSLVEEVSADLERRLVSSIYYHSPTG
ncbi:MAG: signal peptide peptidase SppA [Dehalococcoidia bacterium]